MNYRISEIYLTPGEMDYLSFTAVPGEYPVLASLVSRFVRLLEPLPEQDRCECGRLAEECQTYDNDQPGTAHADGD